jgi:ATP phosphoribosyltransferase regulatory subunit
MKKFVTTPEGTRDKIFDECSTVRIIENKSSDLFRSRGYNEIITPGIEYYDIFNMEETAIPEEELYKAVDNKNKSIVFRPDSTLPIARLVVSRLKNIDLPLRLYYRQPVYRNTPSLSGQRHEFLQTGVELIGIGGIRADTEVIALACDLIKQFVGNFRLEIGHAGLINNVINKLTADEYTKESIKISIERKNYSNLDNILDELEDSEEKNIIRKMPRLFGGIEVFKEAEKILHDKKSVEILDYLKELYSMLNKLGYGNQVILDLGLVQQNDYYTGVVFSTFTENYGESLIKGGRYDKLLEKFGRDMPAVGFAMDTDAVSELILSENDQNRKKKHTILIHTDISNITKGLEKQKELISKGNKCELSLFQNLDEAKKYALENGFESLISIEDKLVEYNLGEAK